jgi:PelA/Pel-15E family pectate lyase
MMRGVLLAVTACCCLVPAAAGAVTWKECLRQDTAWYRGEEAARIAGNVLLYQRESGGWPKNLDMAAVLTDRDRAVLAAQKRQTDSTIDNGATCSQMIYLARVYDATQDDRFKNGFLRGMEFLLRAQYANGGWPQYFPNPSGYHRHITFNDDAMIRVASLLREVARAKSPYAFVGEDARARADTAVRKGIACILRCQIRVKGKLTAWCAQHDERTLAPAPARSYEKVSLSGSESVGIVRFLMGVEQPSREIIEAVQAAVAWFDAVKLTGIRLVSRPDPELAGGVDRVIIPDPMAPSLWARFYEIGTNRPIFCGRDGVIRRRLADIEHERRIGYAWYTTAPARLLEKEYPAWQARSAPSSDALTR